MQQSVSSDLSDISNVNKKNLDELVGLVEELVINKVRIEKMKNEFSDNANLKILDQELRIISEIQASIKKVKLIKIKTIVNSLLNSINQFCIEYNIKADFIFDGQESEIESSLISYVQSILIFLIKDIFDNEFIALDRKSNQIKISGQSDSKNFTIVIEDNGKGIEYDASSKVLDKELLKLRSDLIHFDGSMKSEAKADEFRRIIIVIPLPSSIMQGLLVTVGDQTFAIPLDFIETIINKNAVKTMKSNNSEMVVYMDKVIRLVRVSELLDIKASHESSCILIVNANNRRAALLVDSLLDQIDMVIKPKHKIMMDIAGVKGTTILGDGLVTLVLDIPSILKEI